jgi:hypothetical protein
MTPTFGPLLEHPYPKIQETMQQHLGHIFKGEQNGHLFAFLKHTCTNPNPTTIVDCRHLISKHGKQYLKPLSFYMSQFHRRSLPSPTLKMNHLMFFGVVIELLKCKQMLQAFIFCHWLTLT